MMRRFMLLVTVVLLMAAMMLVLAGPASAQAGCQGFGQFVAEGAPHSGVAAFAPNVDDLIFDLKAANC
jgi:hypothetical protein